MKVQATSVCDAAVHSTESITPMSAEEFSQDRSVHGNVSTKTKQSARKKQLPAHYIKMLSSINLGRKGLAKGAKAMEFKCTVCGSTRKLGRDSAVLVRVEFVGGEEVLCERCADIFAEVMRFGNVVFSDMRRWKISTKVVRVSYSQEYLQCFRCWQKNHSHLFVRCVDTKAIGKRIGVNKIDIRCCSQCAMTYLYGVRAGRLFEEEMPYE